MSEARSTSLIHEKHRQKMIMLGGSGSLNLAVRGKGFSFLRPQGPGGFNSRPSSQFTRNSEHKVHHISKITNRKYLKMGSALVSENFTSFGTKNI